MIKERCFWGLSIMEGTWYVLAPRHKRKAQH